MMNLINLLYYLVSIGFYIGVIVLMVRRRRDDGKN